MNAIIRLLPILLILAVLVTIAVGLILAARKQVHAERLHAAFESDMQDLALSNLDVYPVLSKAILDRIRRGRVATLAHPPHTLSDDLISLAIKHRAKEPEFATILTDSIRTWSPEDRPREIG